MIDLLKSYFLIEARDEPRRMREKVTGKLLSLDETLRSRSACTARPAGPGRGSQAWEALDPAQRRQRTLDSVKRLLLRESQVQPLVVVFEDLHWIDSETQAFLDGLVESLPTAQLLLLVNYRPEYQHGWGSKTYYHQLQIAPLPSESAGALLQGLLGRDTSLESLKSLLIPRTGGQSLLPRRECAHAGGDRDAGRRPRRVSAGPRATGIQVPTTVQAVLAARTDRLASEDKRLLQAAAVIGKDVPFPLLQAIVDVPEPELRRSLTNLQAAEFLLIQPDLRAGGSLPLTLHGLCLRTLCWLALDLVELGELDRALSVAQEAAGLAAALADVTYKPSLLANFVVPWSHLIRGEVTLAIPALERGLAHCKSLNDPVNAVPYSAALGRAYTLARRTAEAVALLEETILNAETENRANRSLWLSFLSEAYLQSGRSEDATRAARRGLEGARERQERGEEAWNLHALAVVAGYAEPPDVAGAESHYGTALALGTELGMRPPIARCQLGLGKLYRRTGKREQAREHLTTATSMYREMDMRFWLEQAEAELKELGA